MSPELQMSKWETFGATGAPMGVGICVSVLGAMTLNPVLVGAGIITAALPMATVASVAIGMGSVAATGFSGYAANYTPGQVATNMAIDAAVQAASFGLAKFMPGVIGALGKPLAVGISEGAGISQVAACKIVSPLLNGVATATVMGGIGAASGGAYGYVSNGWAGARTGAWNGFVGGAITGGIAGAVQGLVDPFVCFTAGTLVHNVAGKRTIETLRVGRRTLTEGTKNAAGLPGDDSTQVDPATWRLVRMRTAKPAGSDNLVDAELLRPLAWIEQSRAVVGSQIHFELAELGIDGPACVLAIEPCPEIEAGRGRVITGTFSTARCHFLDLRLVGSDEVLHPTPSHRFFSVDRNDYVPAEELQPGERLRTRSGQEAAVESLKLNPEPERVYNLEVEGEHNYFVGEMGVLVHNACHPLADTETSELGEQFRVRAQQLWQENLPKTERYGATIAVSEVDGQQVVSLFANIGPGKYQFSEAQVNEFLASVEESGGVAIHTSGDVHAEVALHQQFPEAPAIGISNPNGPCAEWCGPYFEPRGYYNLYWPGSRPARW